MPITSNGFEAKRYQTIVNEINSDQKTNIASDVDVTPESLLGTITAIFSAAISSQEELAQSVADSFNIDKAECKYLDDLVALVGLSRLSESPTVGRLVCTGADLTVVPINNQFSDGTNQFQSTESLVLSENQCVGAVYTLSSVTSGNTYSIKINSTTYSYVALVSDAVDDVMSNLESQINSDINNVFATATYNTDNNKLTVESSQLLVPMLLLSSNEFLVDSVSSVVQIENLVVGPVEVEANTVTTISDAVTGLVSVTNPLPLNTGRNDETDEELRFRHSQTVISTGTATVPSIKAALSQVEGVTAVDIVENTSTVPDQEGRPGKSYECVVTGGSSVDIAQTIFDTKPAGVETYGSLFNLVEFDGFKYSVYFSRPVPIYIWALIEYDIYDEEVFPINGEDGIRDAFVSFGETLGNGVDVIPKRFYKNIYDSVSGINNITVKIAATTSPAITPSPSAYLEVTIPISAKQVSSFDNSRVTVSLV